MIAYLKITGIVLAACLLQMTLLPRYLLDPFQPNLLIILVVYLGLKAPHRLAGLAAFALGLLQDSFSGMYLGLHAFSYLCIYLLLSELADRLYTDNRLLFVLVVLLATVFSAALNLLMLAVFSVSQGVYASLLPALIPQALVNALIASLFFGVRLPVEEAR
ncbi:cell shape-determining protein MreD, putative [Citrifermentans bemidjiense Bem]|uniref:Cell shape-determining protein MreD, putative n=1 Tax=Citrifermentans bemidjiense (strain ATCC BAA-1014 / DSM 16622 / JCM 12645 / Bem) TaxID=404380 RepID=B5EG04_CITBB|nr:rod shape-determining protein MreD [Citrifermentans bemidjiense]ACH39469.1 cell shape-determining protein MreD, putative [Citrifermentans bemidjiense Bem]